MSITLAGGRRLLLAGSQLGWFWIVTGLVALALLVVLYREERRLVSRRAGLGLLALRVLAALFLVAMLFEPISARTFRETVRGRLIVAVDVSESMATADPDRPQADADRLAAALRVDRNQSVRDLSRREIAAQLVDSRQSPLGPLVLDHTVEAFTFDRDLTPAAFDTLPASILARGKPNDPAGLVTDWHPALAEALKSSGAAPVLGVVLVTDGRRNAPDDTAPTVDRLAARGIPVYPVLVGSPIPPRDAAIAAVKAPETVFKGDVASIQATLKLDGYAGNDVSVTLDRRGGEPLKQTVRAPADGTRPTVTFRVPMDSAGMNALTIAIDPLAGDARPENNRRTALIQVADDRAKVLLVDGEARWEFRYLRNALARDPRVTVDAVVFHQPPMGNMSALTYGAAFPEVSSGPLAPDPLADFDVVVIGDVDPADATPEVWSRLERYVSERGGTLVISPGPRFWPGLQGRHEVVRRLLPVLDPVPVPVAPDAANPAHPALPGGTVVVPSTDALADPSAWPMLHLVADPAQARALWDSLPGLPWALGAQAKPGATVLATAGDGSSAVVAAQPYGLGKVLWVGTDSTWRWRYRVGDTYHHRFWGQVVRWAASGKLASGNTLVRFGPLKARIANQGSVTIQARVADVVAGVTPDVLIAARLYRADKPRGDAIAVVPLHAVAGRLRTFEGTAPSLPVGSYVIRLDAPELAEALGLGPGKDEPEAMLEVVARDSSELVELAASRAPLDPLASATSGRVFHDYEAAQLPPLIRSRTVETTRTAETPLWDHPVALAVFVLIVTIEWVARKAVGLP